MNDYSFGNRLLSMRNKCGMTQRQVASYFGVTDKAVSKWETGTSKPTTNALRKLAELYGVSVDDMLGMRDDIGEKSVTKIVITGGPCAGKSTAMSWIQDEFSKRGYGVLFVPETATELIMAGAAPWAMSPIEFQKCVLRWQLDKERVFEQAALAMPSNKVLIVCDRGAMDNRAYMTQAEFSAIMNNIGTSEIELRDGYDAVFHLVTAANGAEEFYTTANNSARTETPEQAREVDEKLISAWTGHPHLRIIGNEQSFRDKMLSLVGEISSFLGEPEPYEIERKFLIKYPDIKWLESNQSCQRVEIIQTYLRSDDGDEVRVRQRGCDGSYVYIELSYRDGNEFTIYQNLDSFGPRRITGVYNLSTDESLGSVIRGMYDYENGDWNHRYIIRNLFSDRMTWIATDDAQNVSVYKRCPGVPQEILDAYKDEIEAEESEK